jgi:hypothetical protein
MNLNRCRLRLAAFSGLLVILLEAPFFPLEGTLETVESTDETIEQAQADRKAFFQKIEMQREAGNPFANDESTVAKLAVQKLDRVQWANTDVQAVLADLTLRSKEVDPGHVGIQFVADLPADLKETDKLGRVLNNNVCIVLGGKISIYDLLMDISEQTNLAFRVGKNTVIFRFWKPGDNLWVGLFAE